MEQIMYRQVVGKMLAAGSEHGWVIDVLGIQVVSRVRLIQVSLYNPCVQVSLAWKYYGYNLSNIQILSLIWDRVLFILFIAV